MLVPHPDGLGRHGRHGRGRYYPYYMMPTYYQAEKPKPKYAILNPAGKVVGIVTGMPQWVPPGHTVRPATVAEVVKASTGTISGLGEGEESLF